MKVMSKITIEILKKNKKRTIVTIIGIALSSALLFGIGLFASTIRENILKEYIAMYGSQHAIFENVSNKDFPIFNNNKIKEAYKTSVIFSVTKGEINLNLMGTDTNFNKYFSLSQGEYPKQETEVIISKNYALDNKITIGKIMEFDIEQVVHKYKVVGIYDRSSVSGYRYVSSMISQNEIMYTTLPNQVEIANVYLIFKNIDNVFNEIGYFANQIGRKYNVDTVGNIYYEGVTINREVLYLYGTVENTGTMAVLFISLLLILTILGTVCVFIITNSFSISVTERKKIFGMLSSVGTSRSQILNSVFFEALIVSIIAIPLGFIFSLIIVTFVLLVINNILSGIIEDNFTIAMYPLFIYMPLIFTVITIFLSALFPAKRASEITPIEAIRMNKDIKINHRKIKTSKLIRLLFGIEGEIAARNIKRNKKKYRTTIISLCISIVLFITFGTYINYIVGEIDKNKETGSYDIQLNIPYFENQDKMIKEIKNIEEVELFINIRQQYTFIDVLEDKYYTKEYQDYLSDLPYNNNKIINIVLLDEEKYEKYKKELNINDDKPIVINKFIYTNYDEITHKATGTHEISKYNINADLKMDLCNYKDNQTKIITNCYYQLSNFHFVEMKPDELNEISASIIVNKETYNDIYKSRGKDIFYDMGQAAGIFINTNSYKPIDSKIKSIINKYQDIETYYYNIKMNNYNAEMIILAAEFAVYSFIVFITLIAVTSVINTINTSINLRKREFAILRSVGLSPDGFNKMIRLESIFFGIKSLIYGLTASCIIIYLIMQITGLSYGANKIEMPFPTIYILICIISIIVIIFITMEYSTRKIKNDNIIETIREDYV